MTDDLAELKTLVLSNAKAIQALSNEALESQRRIEANFENLFSVVQQVSQDIEAKQTETSRQIQALVDEARADRQVNTTEHQAFREQFQQLLSQIVAALNSIWQRLAG
jgi:hypothetical protein